MGPLYSKKQWQYLFHDNNFSMYQATFIEIDNIRSRYAYLYHYMDFNPDDYLSRDQITIKTLDDK